MISNTQRMAIVFTLLALLAGCTAPQPGPAPTIEVTRIVTQVVTPTGAPAATVPSVPTAGAEGPRLRAAVNVYPGTLDPQLAGSAEEQALLQLLYEGLTRLDDHLQPQPGAADSWTPAEDGLSIDFHVREGLTYADGRPINALRFVYALKRALRPHKAEEYGAAPHADWLDDIAGAKDWRTADPAGKAEDLLKLETALGIKAFDMAGKPCQNAPDGYNQADCRTLRIELARASATLLTVLALPVAYPVPQESVEDPAAGQNWWQNSRLQAGNGPFVLAHLEPYVRAVFARNPHYWRGYARLGEIDVAFLTAPEQALELYRAGALDIAPLSAADLAAVKDDRTLQPQVKVFAGACNVSYFFNLRKAPFDNIGVRRAVARALDRSTWASEVDQGLGWTTESWIAPGLPGSEPPVEGWAFDPQAARDELAQAGFPAAAGLAAIKLTYPATARGKERSDLLAKQLQANLDVRAKLDPLEPDAYTKALESQDSLPQFYRVGTCAAFPDPSAWLEPLFRSDSAAAQRQGYANQEVDDLLARAYGEYNVLARADLYRQAHQQIIRDLPMIVMDNIANAYLVRPEVSGLVTTPQDSVLPGVFEPLTLDVQP